MSIPVIFLVLSGFTSMIKTTTTTIIEKSVSDDGRFANHHARMNQTFKSSAAESPHSGISEFTSRDSHRANIVSALLRTRSYGNVTARFGHGKTTESYHSAEVTSDDATFETGRPELELQFTSNNTGYVQTPGWDGYRIYPRDMNSWVVVEVPVDQVVMLSFVKVDLVFYHFETCDSHRTRDTLALYAGNGTTEEDLFWRSCIRAPVPGPTLLRVPRFHVHFVSNFVSAKLTGFRLRFSFHDKQQALEKVEGGLWNCSVPAWQQYRQHFPCNLLQDCVNREDENKCPYTDASCGDGYISLEGKCYFYAMAPQEVMWTEASALCVLRDAHLASLNTPKEWNDVMRLLRRYAEDSAYVGLQSPGPGVPEIYRGTPQWSDGTVAYYLHIYGFVSDPYCGHYMENTYRVNYVQLEDCGETRSAQHYLCETDMSPNRQRKENTDALPTETSVIWNFNSSSLSFITCPSGHVTYDFLACDTKSECWSHDEGSANQCRAPLFTCSNGLERVAFTFVCDFRSDCSDASDERFCTFPLCRKSEFPCSNRRLECVPLAQRCDGVENCLNGADERSCSLIRRTVSANSREPPGVVDAGTLGQFTIRRFRRGEDSCPETHFLCPGVTFFCLPVYVRCNDVYDCPGKQDEDGCDSYTCPGFYRCRGSSVCLHAEHLCDGVSQCPASDDERFCDVTCPEGCTCYVMAFVCRQRFKASDHPGLRYLEAIDTGMTPEELSNNTLLVHLSLRLCGLTKLRRLALPNLRTLDLSGNQLTSLDDDALEQLTKLQRLYLAGNPILPFKQYSTVNRQTLPALRVLDLSRIPIEELHIDSLKIFPNLQSINLSDSGVARVVGEGFQSFVHLRVLDVRGCPMTEFPRGLLDGLTSLNLVFADNYRLCCPKILPAGFNRAKCFAPVDEISSCAALLRSDFYRILLSGFAAMALLGNFGSFVYRVVLDKAKNNQGFVILVAHLCLSDFLMGVYLAMIGVADRVYQGTYLWNDIQWKQSGTCKVAGFLSLLSSEVSAFIICLITLDRFLVLRFPFSDIHLGRKSAHVACAVVWVLGIILAAVPLLPFTSHWSFYSQNGICIPLPITRKDFAGHGYSFAVIIVLNFVLFVLIAVGQVSVYWSIRTNRISTVDTTKKSQDLTIARRLITIAMSDFLCWFPIGVLGLLASNSIPVPSEVNVTVAILLLPINSALNPFLYTINMILERRRLTQERRMAQIIMSSVTSKTSDVSYVSPCRGNN